MTGRSGGAARGCTRADAGGQPRRGSTNLGDEEREPHSHRLPRDIIAMDQDLLGIENVADDYLYGTQCGGCEIRRPNTLVGDFYQARTETVKVVRAARARMVDKGARPRRLEAVDPADQRAQGRVRAGYRGGQPNGQERVRGWGKGLDIPVGAEAIMFVECEAAFTGPSNTRAMAQVLHLADWRASGVKRVIAIGRHDYIHFTEGYPRTWRQRRADPGPAPPGRARLVAGTTRCEGCGDRWRRVGSDGARRSTSRTKGRTMTESNTETPVLDLLARMTADSLDTSNLDAQTVMLVRIAALVAVDAAPVSYLLNLGAASEIGIDAEQVRGVLAAVAPIVGTARVAAATGNLVAALGVAVEVAELEAERNQ